MSDLNKLNYKAYIPDRLGLFHTCQMKDTIVLTLLMLWAQMFKTDDKTTFSNIKYLKPLPFLLKKDAKNF